MLLMPQVGKCSSWCREPGLWLQYCGNPDCICENGVRHSECNREHHAYKKMVAAGTVEDGMDKLCSGCFLTALDGSGVGKDKAGKRKVCLSCGLNFVKTNAAKKCGKCQFASHTKGCFTQYKDNLVCMKCDGIDYAD